MKASEEDNVVRALGRQLYILTTRKGEVLLLNFKGPREIAQGQDQSEASETPRVNSLRRLLVSRPGKGLPWACSIIKVRASKFRL